MIILAVVIVAIIFVAVLITVTAVFLWAKVHKED